MTPRVEKLEGNVYRLTLPQCVFPAWRADGAPSHVTTLLPKHPLAAGLREKWDIPKRRCTAARFMSPSRTKSCSKKIGQGETFASGSVWNVGKGRVFYFRPATKRIDLQASRTAARDRERGEVDEIILTPQLKLVAIHQRPDDVFDHHAAVTAARNFVARE